MVEHTDQANRDTDEMGQLHVIADDSADRRLADRLVRAGLSVAQVSPHSLGGPVRGMVYVAAGTRVPDVDVPGIIRAGAHLWILPPFPEQPLALATGGVVSIAPARRRDGVHLSQPILDAVGSSSIPARPLRILYRDRIAGGVSTSLAESAEGEMLAGAMPRVSNLHGQLVVTSLMLGTASAQTDLDDVALAVRALESWCTASEAVPAAMSDLPRQQASPVITIERDAQLVVLALALALDLDIMGDLPHTHDDHPVVLATIRQVVEQVCAVLGKQANEDVFSHGCEWLLLHGVLLDMPIDEGAPVHTDSAAMREVIQKWQLLPRLRRLSRMPLQ